MLLNSSSVKQETGIRQRSEEKGGVKVRQRWKKGGSVIKRRDSAEENSSSFMGVSVVGELSLWVVLTDGIQDLRLTNHYPLSQLENVSTNIQGQRDGETPLMSGWYTVLWQHWKLHVFTGNDPADTYKRAMFHHLHSSQMVWDKEWNVLWGFFLFVCHFFVIWLTLVKKYRKAEWPQVLHIKI